MKKKEFAQGNTRQPGHCCADSHNSCKRGSCKSIPKFFSDFFPNTSPIHKAAHKHCCSNYPLHNKQHQTQGHQCHKRLVILFPDAVIQPSTMMIETIHALIAASTMFAKLANLRVTEHAKQYLVFHSKLLKVGRTTTVIRGKNPTKYQTKQVGIAAVPWKTVTFDFSFFQNDLLVLIFFHG